MYFQQIHRRGKVAPSGDLWSKEEENEEENKEEYKNKENEDNEVM